ncbi:hypothetical protein [Novosphingopyxis sp.]|uniref:hypothetical protein n=1 Tax=Novosphingopyxis sp. TaxID=2709690 RepID=UPI003B596AB5
MIRKWPPFRNWLAAVGLALSLCLGLPAAAQAEVVATFYSQDFGDSFPHAFVKLNGTDDATGVAVDTNYGFTAVNIGPGILLGSVKGRLDVANQRYIDASDAHFSVRLSDAQYRSLVIEVRRWAGLPQPSYSLGKANCVHFIGAMATSIGLRINEKTAFWKKPKSFLREVKGLNPGVLPPAG